MEESDPTLDAEKANLEERIRQLEASNQYLEKELGYAQVALNYQREKLYESERSGVSRDTPWYPHKAEWKIRENEDYRYSLISKIQENNRELNSCIARLGDIKN